MKTSQTTALVFLLSSLRVVSCLFAIACLMTSKLAIADTSDSISSQSPKNVEQLYQECKRAKAEYSNQPEKIADSICGTYIQGFIGGFQTPG